MRYYIILPNGSKSYARGLKLIGTEEVEVSEGSFELWNVWRGISDQAFTNLLADNVNEVDLVYIEQEVEYVTTTNKVYKGQYALVSNAPVTDATTDWYIAAGTNSTRNLNTAYEFGGTTFDAWTNPTAAYLNTATYAINDYTIEAGNLYQNDIAITVGEDFDTEKWTLITNNPNNILAYEAINDILIRVNQFTTEVNDLEINKGSSAFIETVDLTETDSINASLATNTTEIASLKIDTNPFHADIKRKVYEDISAEDNYTKKSALVEADLFYVYDGTNGRYADVTTLRNALQSGTFVGVYATEVTLNADSNVTPGTNGDFAIVITGANTTNEEYRWVDTAWVATGVAATTADGVSFNPATSSLTETNVQDAIDETVDRLDIAEADIVTLEAQAIKLDSSGDIDTDINTENITISTSKDITSGDITNSTGKVITALNDYETRVDVLEGATYTAPRATADADGNVITDTYATKTESDNKLDKTTGGTVAGAVTFQSGITVEGTTTFVDTTNMTISDNEIVINEGEEGAGITAGSAGIRVERGTEADATLLFNETGTQWEINNGTTTVVIADEAPVILNTAHKNGDGSDHADVASNTAALAGKELLSNKVDDITGLSTDTDKYLSTKGIYDYVNPINNKVDQDRTNNEFIYVADGKFTANLVESSLFNGKRIYASFPDISSGTGQFEITINGADYNNVTVFNPDSDLYVDFNFSALALESTLFTLVYSSSLLKWKIVAADKAILNLAGAGYDPSLSVKGNNTLIGVIDTRMTNIEGNEGEVATQVLFKNSYAVTATATVTTTKIAMDGAKIPSNQTSELTTDGGDHHIVLNKEPGFELSLNVAHTQTGSTGTAISTIYPVIDIQMGVADITVGKTYRVSATGNTDFTLMGATTASTEGEVFEATGAGSGTGMVQLVIGEVSIETGTQFEFKERSKKFIVPNEDYVPETNIHLYQIVTGRDVDLQVDDSYAKTLYPSGNGPAATHTTILNSPTTETPDGNKSYQDVANIEFTGHLNNLLETDRLVVTAHQGSGQFLATTDIVLDNFKTFTAFFPSVGSIPTTAAQINIDGTYYPIKDRKTSTAYTVADVEARRFVLYRNGTDVLVDEILAAQVDTSDDTFLTISGDTQQAVNESIDTEITDLHDIVDNYAMTYDQNETIKHFPTQFNTAGLTGEVQLLDNRDTFADVDSLNEGFTVEDGYARIQGGVAFNAMDYVNGEERFVESEQITVLYSVIENTLNGSTTLGATGSAVFVGDINITSGVTGVFKNLRTTRADFGPVTRVMYIGTAAGTTGSILLKATIIKGDHTGISDALALWIIDNVPFGTIDDPISSNMNNVVIEGTTFSNLIVNGDFSNGTTNWTTVAGTLSETNQILSVTGDGSSALLFAYQSLDRAASIGDIINVFANMEIPAEATTLQIQLFDNLTTIEDFTITLTTGEYVDYNNKITLANNYTDLGIGYRFIFPDAGTQNGKIVNIDGTKGVFAIPMTGTKYEDYSEAQMLEVVRSGYQEGLYQTDNTITTTGENLFDKNDMEYGSLSGADGLPVSDGVVITTRSKNYIPAIPGIYYTSNFPDARTIIFQYDSNFNFIASLISFVSSVQRTLVDGTAYIKFRVDNRNNGTDFILPDDFDNGKIELGLTPTDYKSYHSNTITYDNRANYTAGAVGNSVDEEGNLIERVKLDTSVVKNGTTWSIDRVLTNTHNFELDLSSLGYKIPATNAVTPIITMSVGNTIFQVVTYDYTVTNDVENLITIRDIGRVVFKVNKTTYVDTAAFEAYLQANDVEFYYELETPVTTQVDPFNLQAYPNGQLQLPAGTHLSSKAAAGLQSVVEYNTEAIANNSKNIVINSNDIETNVIAIALNTTHSGTVTGNPHSLNIDDLTDVDTTTVAPTDGQVLTWDNTDGEWQPADVSAGTGDFLADGTVPMTDNLNNGNFSILNSNGLFSAGSVDTTTPHLICLGSASTNNITLASGTTGVLELATGVTTRLTISETDIIAEASYTPANTKSLTTKDYVDDNFAAGDFKADGTVPMTATINMDGNSLGNLHRIYQTTNNLAAPHMSFEAQDVWLSSSASGSVILRNSTTERLTISSTDILAFASYVPANTKSLTTKDYVDVEITETSATLLGDAGYAVGSRKYDTTNSKPVWSDGTIWRYADGTAVA